MKSRIEREKQTVSLMVQIYCRRAEGNKVMCNSCMDLIDYAHSRLSHCPYGEKKPPCKRCATHCYNPVMRDYIRRVMRFSGPRMILYSPMAAFRHILKM